MSVLNLNMLDPGGNSFGPLSNIRESRTLDYSAAVYGTPIPLSQGRRGITGKPVWFGPLTVANGYGPGGFSWTLFTSWSRNFAVAFGYNLALAAEHADPQIRRMWINGALAYDMSGLGALTSAASLLSGLKFTLYPGNEAQNVDPLIFADKGTLASPLRGMIYIVFQDLLLGKNVSFTSASFYDNISIANDFANRRAVSKTFGTDGDGGAFANIFVEFVDGSVTQAVATPIPLNNPAITL